MKAALVCLTVLALAGCTVSTNNDGVFSPQITQAQKLCVQNDGVFVIVRSEREAEFEKCGYKCARGTGRYKYTAVVKCNNGAVFNSELMQ